MTWLLILFTMYGQQISGSFSSAPACDAALAKAHLVSHEQAVKDRNGRGNAIEAYAGICVPGIAKK
jgi:hypothetical protein